MIHCKHGGYEDCALCRVEAIETVLRALLEEYDKPYWEQDENAADAARALLTPVDGEADGR